MKKTNITLATLLTGTGLAALYASCGKPQQAELNRGPLSIRGAATSMSCNAVVRTRETTSSMVKITKEGVAAGSFTLNQTQALSFLSSSLTGSLNAPIDNLNTSAEDLGNARSILSESRDAVKNCQERLATQINDNPNPILIDAIVSDRCLTPFAEVEKLKCKEPETPTCENKALSAIKTAAAAWELDQAINGCKNANIQADIIKNLLVELAAEQLTECEVAYNTVVSKEGAEFLKRVREQCPAPTPTPAPVVSPKSYRISFQTRRGFWMNMQNSQDEVKAIGHRNTDPNISDELFVLQDLNGGNLVSGDAVTIISRSSRSIGVSQELERLVGQVTSEDSPALRWTLNKVDGGSIQTNDKVFLKSPSGKIVNCRDSEGFFSLISHVNIDPAVSDELFTILLEAL